MKKFMVVFMVLVMASIATAGVEWDTSYDEGTQVGTAVLKGDNISQFILTSITGNGGGTFGGLSVNAGFDNFAAGATFAGSIYGDVVYSPAGAISVGTPTVSGDLYTFTYTFASPLVGEAVMTLAGNALAKEPDGAGGSIVYSVGNAVFVPEPMTMALLGLGGLFLRRRK